jgi:hypothetical protein
MATLDDILSALGSASINKVRRAQDQLLRDARTGLSRTGALASPAAAIDYFTNINNQTNDQLAQLLPQLDLQAYQLGLQRRDRASDELYRQQQAAEQAAARRTAEQQWEREFGVRERQMTLAELLQQAQAEAARRQAEDWTTPILQGLATSAGIGLGKTLADMGFPLLAKLFGSK